MLPHPQLTERLLLCQPSPDLPDWWECGRHDHDLLLGASRHGVSRTDYHILNDPQLAFLEAHRRSHTHKGGAVPRHAPTATPDPGATPLLTPAEVASAAGAAAATLAKEEVEEEVEEKIKVEGETPKAEDVKEEVRSKEKEKRRTWPPPRRR